jgi:hypothetical protein
MMFEICSTGNFRADLSLLLGAGSKKGLTGELCRKHGTRFSGKIVTERSHRALWRLVFSSVAMGTLRRRSSQRAIHEKAVLISQNGLLI